MLRGCEILGPLAEEGNEIDTLQLSDVDQEQLEAVDTRYNELIVSDKTLQAIFEADLAEHRDSFEPL